SVVGLGAKAVVTRVRNTKAEDIPVNLIAAPDQPARAEQVTDAASAIPGMTLTNINPAVIAEYGLPLTARGVAISDPGQIGARAGLLAGDILKSINAVDALDVSTALGLLRQANRRLTLEVQRDGREMIMRFRL
ncbi:MAG: PDZ domain-containing protein, partial [Roseovarius sp.]|nr:PDZ domain-containing protein [Roseovarius sp.]